MDHGPRARKATAGWRPPGTLPAGERMHQPDRRPNRRRASGARAGTRSWRSAPCADPPHRRSNTLTAHGPGCVVRGRSRRSPSCAGLCPGWLGAPRWQRTAREKARSTIAEPVPEGEREDQRTTGPVWWESHRFAQVMKCFMFERVSCPPSCWRQARCPSSNPWFTGGICAVR